MYFKGKWTGIWRLREMKRKREMYVMRKKEEKSFPFVSLLFSVLY